uniref:Uncharacterized protein n=1 Tax=Kwoniella pini CBS 10737 TaxID=1296096 RepID=A0A1B9I2W8_9TREE|nr:uncharacterized protein I206_04415 [Kwoniella pini CBS 10737]OCF49886.1 hypothetical protein I206_04415 [Kwoniella pini CBS 10737]
MLHDMDNTSLELEFGTLALNLREMWYQHGYTGLRYFRQHIADIYKRFEFLDEEKADPETIRAAESACNDLLALHAVPNETWLPYVNGIKRRVSQSNSTQSSPQESPMGEQSSTVVDMLASREYEKFSASEISHRRATT